MTSLKNLVLPVFAEVCSGCSRLDEKAAGWFRPNRQDTEPLRHSQADWQAVIPSSR